MAGKCLCLRLHPRLRDADSPDVAPAAAGEQHMETIGDVNRQIAEKVLSQFRLGTVPEWTGMEP